MASAFGCEQFSRLREIDRAHETKGGLDPRPVFSRKCKGFSSLGKSLEKNLEKNSVSPLISFSTSDKLRSPSLEWRLQQICFQANLVGTFLSRQIFLSRLDDSEGLDQ